MTFELAILSTVYVVLYLAAAFAVQLYLEGRYMRSLERQCKWQRILDNRPVPGCDY